MNINGVEVTGKTFTRNKMGGMWKFEYKHNGQDRTLNIFNKDVGKMGDVEVGDTADLVIEQNSKGYWELVSAVKSSAASPPGPKPPTYSRGVQDEDTTLRIARSVALKAATDIVAATVRSDNTYYKKGASPEIFAGDILAIAASFEKYLVLEDQTDMEEVDLMEPENVTIN